MPVRIYTTRGGGLEEQARFGLENACKIVDYFSEVVYNFLLARQNF